MVYLALFIIWILLFIPLIKSSFLVEGIKLLLFSSVVVICRLYLLSPLSYPQLLLLLLSHTFTGSGFQHRPLSLSYTVFSLQLLECSFRWQGNCQLQKALSSLQTPKQHYPSSSACQEKRLYSSISFALDQNLQPSVKLTLRPTKITNYTSKDITFYHKKCRQFLYFLLPFLSQIHEYGMDIHYSMTQIMGK